MINVLIVGGSVAGLSAALLLGRCRQTVVVCDAGRPRNRFSRHMHGFLSREGVPPDEFLQICRDQISEFPHVRIVEDEVISLKRNETGFTARTKNGTEFQTQTVLLATGISDKLPDLPGIGELYGLSVHHCPYCDGWEHRDAPLAVYGKGNAALELALEMPVWSPDVMYFSDGEMLSSDDRAKLEAMGIGLIQTKIAALSGREGKLEKILLADGKEIERAAMFFVSSQHQNNELAHELGCEMKDGFVTCTRDVHTGVSGLYAAGNTSTGLQLAIVAAAEGAKAAHHILTELNAATLAQRTES